MYKTQIEKDLTKAVESLGLEATDIVLSIPDKSDFGDYSSNIALQLAKLDLTKKYQSPHEIANAILDKLNHPHYLERVEIAGAGFINFYLSDKSLMANLSSNSQLATSRNKASSQKLDARTKTLIEYASPNAFKPLHIGHFRNITTGEAISRILEQQGDEIFRVTYTSDIGPAVAKALWGVKKLEEEYKKIKEQSSLDEKAQFLGKAYVEGVKAYEEDEKAKAEIDEINIKLYQKDSQWIPLWEETKTWSEAYLNSIYSRLGTEFDAEVWESEVGELGKEIVEQNLGKIFKKDEGAVIFPGEEFDLHNRVFINSQGNPTYEAKELGVTRREQELFPFDRAIHVVSTEQSEYFKVVIKAIEVIEGQMVGKKIHLPHGFVSLTSGKMSSRTGNVFLAAELIDLIKQRLGERFSEKPGPQESLALEKIAIAAAKFYMLKFGLTSDISFDIDKSISVQGDSGPYLLYAYTRAKSILGKASKNPVIPGSETTPESRLANVARVDSGQAGMTGLEAEERAVLRQLEYFDVVLDRIYQTFQISELCNYLLDLAKAFNLLYERHSILGSNKVDLRLALTQKVGDTLKTGLHLLGIEAVEKM